MRMLIDCGVVICNPVYRFAVGIVNLIAGMDVIRRAVAPRSLAGRRVDDKIPVGNGVSCECARSINATDLGSMGLIGEAD